MNDYAFWPVVTGGVCLMIPVAVFFLTAIIIFIVRCSSISKAKQTDESFMKRIRDYVIEGDLENARVLCEHTNNVSGNVILKGVEKIGSPIPEIRESMDAMCRSYVKILCKGLSWIKFLGVVSGLTGFLGTLIGWSIAFYRAGAPETTLSSNELFLKLSESLITAVTGVGAAIIILFLYNILVSLINSVINKADASARELIDLLEEPAL